MERKTTQRVIGVAVIVALVIIMLPLLFGNDSPKNVATLHSPKKPEVLVAANNQKPAEPTPPVPQVIQPPEEKLAINEPSFQEDDIVKNSGNILPAATASETVQIAAPVKNTTPATNAPLAPQVSNNNQPVMTAPPSSSPVPEKSQSVHSRFPSQEVKTATHSQEAAKPNKVIKAIAKVSKNSSPEWAVQVGCFKNKTNAKHLIAMLRKQGYKAFETQAHNMTKVLVGPEGQHAKAHSTAVKLQQDLDLPGIVVAFKHHTA